MNESLKTAAVILGFVGAYAYGKRRGYVEGVTQCKLVLDSVIAGSDAEKEKNKKENEKES